MSVNVGGVRMRIVETSRNRARRETLDGPLSDADGQTVIMATLRGHHPEPVSEDTLVHVLQEVGGMVIGGALAELVITGKLSVRVDDSGELRFSKIGAAP